MESIKLKNNIMKLQYLNYFVESETQIDKDKFSSVLSVYFKMADDKNDLFGAAKAQLIVINSNSQTGFEMDTQREKESITFVENLSQ